MWRLGRASRLGVTGKLTQKVDQVLNNLESLATSESSERSYFQLLLQQLRGLLSCDMVARFQPLRSTEWLVVNCDTNSASAEEGQLAIRRIQEQLSQKIIFDGPASGIPRYWSDEEGQFVAVPIQADSWAAGGIVAQFFPGSQSTASPPQAAAITPILQAFSELSLSYLQRWHSKRWIDHASEVQSVLYNISHCDSREQLYFTLANDLRVFLRADQVAIWHPGTKSRIHLVAMSDCPNVPIEAHYPNSFRAIAQEACRTGKVVSQVEQNNEKEARRWLAFGWPAQQANKSQEIVVVAYWDDESRYVDATYRLCSSFVSLDVLATQVHHQLAVPKWVRQFCLVTSRSAILIRFAAALLLLLALLAFALRSAPFRIEGKAYLEPNVKANVFATHDGVVEKLEVKAGEDVVVGKKLLQIRSTDLEMEEKKLDGELSALQEKRNGFQVSLNQLPADDPQGQLARSQLSAEIIELDQREKQLEQLLQFHRKKEQDLSVYSPVKGFIVTENLQENLAQRPIKRGDRLLQIADVRGLWHLRVEVPDREAGHIKEAFSRDKDLLVRFRIVSDPDREYQGTIARISESIRLNRSNESVWIIDVQFDQSKVPLMLGASVAVQFECGSKPTWYIWTRPLWESLRRRFWL